MNLPTPTDTLTNLINAINTGNVEQAVALYEPDAVFIPEPGVSVSGTEAIREALAAMLVAKPQLVTHQTQTLQNNDVVLHHANWTMTALDPDGQPFSMNGQSADILRRGADGHWRIAVDNPWGTAIIQTSDTIHV
jgi:uncharacterized protein (TIGR02246 family)